MTYSKTCPACGGTAYQDAVDVGVGLIPMGDFECDCGWIEGGPDDYGFILMDERPFCPLPLNESAIIPFRHLGANSPQPLAIEHGCGRD